MKKQLLAAAVAATMTSVAMADISITGKAEYKYTNADASDTTGTADTLNTGAAELNLIIDMKHGDTTAQISHEYVTDGTTTGNDTLDIENAWVATKIGDFGIKMGQWAGATTDITGEIKGNGFSNDKVYVTTSVGDVNLGYYTTPEAADGTAYSDGFTANTTIQGIKLELKEATNEFTAVRVSGEVMGVSFSHENLDDDTAGKDATMSSAEYTYNGITLKADQVQADSSAGLAENDGRFIQYDEGADGANGGGGEITKISQISASMDVAGNTVTLAAAEGEENNGVTNDATKITITRALAGGMNLEATYTDADDDGATTTTDTFTAKLSVAF